MRDRKTPRKDTRLVRASKASLALPGVPTGAAAGNPALQYLADLGSDASRRTMRGVLDQAARIFDAIDRGVTPEESTADVYSYPWGAPNGLNFAKVQATVATFKNRPRSKRRGSGVAATRLVCSALRGVARFAFGLGLLSADERMRIGDVRPPKLTGKTRGDRLTEEEVKALYAVCAADPSPAGRRDAALLAVALGGGARRFELSALEVRDYTRPSKLGIDPVELVIRAGKGKKHAIIVAPPDVAIAIEAWLEVRGREPGPLFSASPGRGRDLEAGSRLSASGVYDVLGRRAEQAKLKRTIAPHDLRRTAITKFLETKGDLGLAKAFARHADVNVTAKYDRRGHVALREAVAGVTTGFGGEE